MTKRLTRNLSLTLGSLALVIAPTAVLANQAWTFTVTNSGRNPITRLEVRESGSSNWEPFGTVSNLSPGEEATFEWGSADENRSCTWSIRAIYADGPTPPASFNFCEETNLVFDN